jgi:hypothetical protein
LSFLTDLHAKGVDLFLHQQGLDTSTPSGRAMFQMLGVFAEFERAMIGERVMAGLARARAEGKQLGRRTVEQSHGAKVKAALKLRTKGIGIRRIAREVGPGGRDCDATGRQRVRGASFVNRCARGHEMSLLIDQSPRGRLLEKPFQKTE